MKHLLVSIAFITMAATANMQAQPSRFRFEKNPEQRYELQVGKTQMAIDAANGARIVSLKYDGTEVLSQINFPNQYGSTFWTSPQKEWNWPPIFEHDMAPYEVSEADGVITMTSPLSEKLPLRITKRFAVNAQKGSIFVTYGICNEGAAPRRVAPWEITRVPAVGTVLFDADVRNITGANGMPTLPFVQNAQGLAQYDIAPLGENRKVNSDGKGWLTYVNNGLALTKRFPDLQPSEPAPDEAEIQIYVDQGGKYVEIESQGAYVELQPGQSVEWTVEWEVKAVVKM